MRLRRLRSDGGTETLRSREHRVFPAEPDQRTDGVDTRTFSGLNALVTSLRLLDPVKSAMARLNRRNRRAQSRSVPGLEKSFYPLYNIGECTP